MLMAEGLRDPRLECELLLCSVSKGENSAQSSSPSNPNPTTADFDRLASDPERFGTLEEEEAERLMPLEEKRFAGGSL